MRRAITLLWISASLLISVAHLHAQSGSLVIENPLMKISVFADKGALNEIVHKPSGVNLRSKTNGAFRSIWNLSLSYPGGVSVAVDSTNTTSFRGSVINNSTGSSLDLTWQG